MNIKSVVLVFVFSLKYSSCEEPGCPRYHYESQILERIIKSEVSWATNEKEVELMKKNVEEIRNDHRSDITNLQDQVEEIRKAFLEFKENLTNQREEKGDSLRSFCTSDRDCLDVGKAECKWLTCKCQPGLSYHRATRQCIPDCGVYGYGITYQEERTTVLNGFATKTIKPVTIEDCLSRCTEMKEFECRTAEYHAKDRICYLSWETLYTNPEANQNSDVYVTFTRDCKN